MNKKSVDFAFPVYYGNLKEIEESISKISNFCNRHLNNYNWNLVLGINGPNTEELIELVKRLEADNHHISHKSTLTPGKGAGIRAVWSESKADIVAYMDIDCSVDLALLPKLLSYMQDNDICVGSRYHKDSKVNRSLLRKIASVGYHKIIQRGIMGTKCEDLHCGFKAFRREVAQKILPYVQDSGWYFDSEIMILAEKLDYAIKTIPVKWDEGKNSGLNLNRVIPAFLLKTIEFKMRPLPENIRKKKSLSNPL